MVIILRLLQMTTRRRTGGPINDNAELPPRPKRARRLTERGKQYARNRDDNMDTNTGPASTSGLNPPSTRPGDLPAPTPPVMTGGQATDPTTQYSGQNTLPGNGVNFDIDFMQNWFLQARNMLDDMCALKDDFTSQLAAARQQMVAPPPVVAAGVSQSQALTTNSQPLPQNTVVQSGGLPQQPQSQPSVQPTQAQPSTQTGAFVTRYALNRNLVNGTSQCGLPTRAGDPNQTQGGQNSMPVGNITASTGNQGVSSVGSVQQTPAVVPTVGQSAMLTAGTQVTPIVHSGVHGAPIVTPVVTQNAASSQAQNNSNQQFIPLVPPVAGQPANQLLQVLTPMSVPVSTTAAASQPQTALTPQQSLALCAQTNEIHVPPLLTQVGTQHSADLPPVESMSDALEQLQIGGIQEHEGEVLVPVAADGMKITMKTNIELQKMLTDCMLVGEGLDAKMVKRIWSGQFVEFYKLIHADEAGIYDVTYSNEDGNKQMSLTHRPKKDIQSYDEWLRAWEVYHVIYLKHPGNRDKHQQMVTYFRHIRQFHEQGLNWLSYDRQFRHQRLSFGKTIPPWGCIRQDLWNGITSERQINGPFREPGVETPQRNTQTSSKK